MAIPSFRDDLVVIGKLPDLPRATNGYPADVFKAQFDKAGLAIQTFINEKLVPAIIANKIPFTPSAEIAADNIQAAIENVQAQVRDAASGSIVNGSVTTEKLSQELLDRVYGGRPWVALDTPGSQHNTAAGFPVGQIWLRPRFVVANRAGTEWTATACSVQAETDAFTLTGSKQAATAKIVQTLTGLGDDGDRVFVLFDVADKDAEITSFTASVNGAGAVNAQGHIVMEAGLMVNGALTVQMEAIWPSASLAGGSVTIQNYAVVNVSQVLRQMSEAHDMADWNAYLSDLLPLSLYTSPAEIYMHVSDGQWWAIGYEIQPVTRGGTGRTEIPKGLVLGNGTEPLETLPHGEDESLLQMQGGKPGWVPQEQFIAGSGALRAASGTYVGNGVKGRTVQLPVKPQVLFIFSSETPDAPLVLCNGQTIQGLYRVKKADNQTLTVSYGAYATLSGDTLTFTCDKKTSSMASDPTAEHANNTDVTQNWVAIY